MTPDPQVLETVRDGCGPTFGLTKDEAFARALAAWAMGECSWVVYEGGQVVISMREHPAAHACQVHAFCSGGPKAAARAWRDWHKDVEKLTEMPCAVTVARDRTSVARGLARSGWERGDEIFGAYRLWTLSIGRRN